MSYEIYSGALAITSGLMLVAIPRMIIVRGSNLSRFMLDALPTILGVGQLIVGLKTFGVI